MSRASQLTSIMSSLFNITKLHSNMEILAHIQSWDIFISRESKDKSLLLIKLAIAICIQILTLWLLLQGEISLTCMRWFRIKKRQLEIICMRLFSDRMLKLTIVWGLYMRTPSAWALIRSPFSWFLKKIKTIPKNKEIFQIKKKEVAKTENNRIENKKPDFQTI